MRATFLRFGVATLVAGAGIVLAAEAGGATAPTAPATVAFRLQPSLSTALPQYARITWSRPTGGDTPTTFDVGIGVDPDDAGAEPVDWNSVDASPSEYSVSSTLTTKVLSCNVALPKRCWVRVRGRAGAVIGDWSTPVAWSWVPSAPRTFRRTAVSGTTATFTWAAPAARGYLATNYQLQRSLDRGVTWSDVGSTTTALTTTNACTSTTTCMYRVRALTSDGSGPPSNRNVLQTLPTVPLYLTASVTESDPGTSGAGAGASTMELGWTRPLRGTPTSYQLQVCSGVCTATTLDSLWTSAATQPGPSDITATGLTCPAAAATCSMRLRGVLVQGATTVYGPWAVKVLRPYAPTVVSVDHGSVQDTIRVYFDQPADLGAGPTAAREYQFLVCAASCGSAANWDVDPDATIAIDSVPSYPWVRNVTCAAETVCSVRMHLVDGAGHQSPLSPASTATGAILPSEPLNVAAVTGSTSGTITVTWDAPGDAGFPAFDHYETSTSTDGGTTWGAWTSTGGTATSIDLACAPGVTCTVRVRAVSEIGAGPSASDSAVGAEVPGAPENVAVVTGTTSGMVDVDWDAPSNLGTPALTEYQTRYSIDAGVTFSAWSNTGSTATSRTITCGAGETCVVQVRAVNSIGTGSSASDSAVAADVPAQLTGFSATLSSGDAVLAWTLGASYPAITDIEYQVSTDGGTTWGSATSLSTTGTGATIAACSSTSNDTCDYRVRAVNGIGDGAWSSVDGFTIP